MTFTFTWHNLHQSSVIFEDDEILAINKPPGLSVMGERHDSDLVQLAQDAGLTLYPVHRIDKVTSGLVLLAKNLAAHGGLTRQFNKQTVDKEYLAITRTTVTPLPERGIIELPLSAGRKGSVRIAAPRDRIQMAAPAGAAARWFVSPDDLLPTRTYPSATRFATAWQNPGYSVIVARPVTGRKHQIRVHLAWIGYPILGDPLFEKPAPLPGQRAYLHSWRLSFGAAWLGDKRLTLEAEPAANFWAPLAGSLPPDAALALVSALRLAQAASQPTRVRTPAPTKPSARKSFRDGTNRDRRRLPRCTHRHGGGVLRRQMLMPPCDRRAGRYRGEPRSGKDKTAANADRAPLPPATNVPWAPLGS